MKIYISGKITGEDYNQAYLKFKTYESKLAGMGHEVVNPMKHISEHTQWPDAMKIAIVKMMDCNTIFMLPNWMESDGAKMEFELAAKLSFKIFMNSDMEHLEKMSKMQIN